MLALAVGAVCLIAWAGGLAFLADLLSKPVLVGYMTGIAGLMILSQVGRATAADIPEATRWPRRGGWPSTRRRSTGPTLAVCLGTLRPAAGRGPAVAHRTGAAGRHARRDPRGGPGAAARRRE